MNEEIKPSKKLAKLFGSIKLPKDFDDKKELEEYFEIKHKLINTNTNQYSKITKLHYNYT